MVRQFDGKQVYKMELIPTVSSSGLPLHRAMASQKRTADRSTGSAGYCHARSSMWVEQSGVDAGMS